MKLSCQPIYQQQTIRKWNKEKKSPLLLHQKKIKHLEINLSKVLKGL